MKKVLVLGGSGMLGSMVCDYLESTGRYDISATVRTEKLLERCKSKLPGVSWLYDNICRTNTTVNMFSLINLKLNKLEHIDYLINCIGITKPYCKDTDAEQVENAIYINSLMPHSLGEYANRNNFTILQIATDCVYSGKEGLYTEDSPHDPIDVYGKTKSLGESYLSSLKNLRCSIIGPEFKSQSYLLEWVLMQETRTEISGFANHNWNGLTTLHFAKIIDGIMHKNIELGHLQHIVPADILNKYELVSLFAKYFNKSITINKVDAPIAIDRTLSTNNKEMNEKLWKAAGYRKAPSLEEMIRELSEYNYRFK